MLYPIWSEGYRATGESAGATYHGVVEANTFEQACQKMFNAESTYDPDKNTLWGCRLFDNEADARKLFG